MCGKKCLSKRDAAAALKHNENRHRRNYRREVRYYYCKECNCWHLTSKELKEDDPEPLALLEGWEKFLNKQTIDEQHLVQ